jgi:serine/threonine protein kinase
VNLYLAPEVKDRQPYNEKVDIFSFGVILRLLLTGSAATPPEPEEEEEPTIAEVPSDNSNSSIDPELLVFNTTATAVAAAPRTPMEILTGTLNISPPIIL